MGLMIVVKPPLLRVLRLLFFSCFYIGDSNEHMISLLRNEPSAYLCGGSPPTVVALKVNLRSFSIRVFEVFVEVLLKKKILN